MSPMSDNETATETEAAPAASEPAAADVMQSTESTESTEITEPRGHREVREGVVVSNKMEKTAVVAVVERVRHPKYGKFMMRTKKLYAHDETNDVRIGDRVSVMETRPLSKNKRWRVVEILERAK